jgi:phytanoyl-CoA hydroxylase
MNKIQTFFSENGYYLAKGVFSLDEIGSLENEFDKIVQQLDLSDTPNNNGVIDTRNVQQYSGRWMAALLHKEFLDLVEQFIGTDIVLNHSTLFEKRTTTAETPFKMHQDWSYLPTQRNTMIAGMIHVSEATEEMGCLRVYPGSHKRGRMPGSTANDAPFHQQFPLEGATIIEAEPGDVTFFDYFIVHGSMSNRSNKPRKVVIARMFSGKDRKEDIYQFSENLVLRGFNYHTTRATARKAVMRPANPIQDPATRAHEK